MTGAQPQSRAPMTVQEFLEWDGGGLLGKLELINGEVRALSPASGTHAIIQGNLAYLIGVHLRTSGRPCRVGTEAAVVPRLHANDNVRAPDLAVEVYRKDAEGAWPKDPEIVPDDGVLRLESIEAGLPVSEIYSGTHLSLTN